LSFHFNPGGQVPARSLTKPFQRALSFGSYSSRPPRPEASPFPFVTKLAGISETRIAGHTGHRDLNVMRRYYRNGMVFKGNPAKEIGL
jgi:hypothetical protein